MNENQDNPNLAPNRLDDFVNRFCEDYSKLEQMFPDVGQKKILRMMGNLEYVRNFTLVPTFCRIEQNPPKGIKKSNGRKVNILQGKSGGHTYRTTEYLIDCGEDLYISGIISSGKIENGKPKIRKMWLVVENWKKIPAMKLVEELERDRKPIQCEIRSAILQIYKDNGLRLWTE